jgi:hypothetical protein
MTGAMLSAEDIVSLISERPVVDVGDDNIAVKPTEGYLKSLKLLFQKQLIIWKKLKKFWSPVKIGTSTSLMIWKILNKL